MIQFGIVKYGILKKFGSESRARDTAAAKTTTSATSKEGAKNDIDCEEDLSHQQCMCDKCEEIFFYRNDLLVHQTMCEAIKEEPEDPEFPDTFTLKASIKASDKTYSQTEDAANNNDASPDADPNVPGHVTLEALQNTKVAVAQFAASALANSADKESALQQFALDQLKEPATSTDLKKKLKIEVEKSQSKLGDLAKEKGATDAAGQKRELDLSPVKSAKAKFETSLDKLSECSIKVGQAPPVSNAEALSSSQLCQVSSSFASSIITNHDDMTEMEPNTLQMLQKRTQEVLDSASAGLLSGNLADELAFRKESLADEKGNRTEPFFKHRCRYCGKVFGSDSALQIHLRSHTGERPFKCNVCGSRFTTKGNLKVHFQRHTMRYPHVPMNQHPIPEHLDKYHPPLINESNTDDESPPPSLSSTPNLTAANQFRQPLDILKSMTSQSAPLLNLSQKAADSNEPADLRKSIPSRRSPSPEAKPLDVATSKRKPIERRSSSPMREMDLSIKKKLKLDEPLPPRHVMNSGFDLAELKSLEKYKNSLATLNMPDESSRDSNASDMAHIRQQEEPENLTKITRRSVTPKTQLPPQYNFTRHLAPDLVKDPALYNSLLPHMGSTDNAWESLIEVTKTSETSKLQQLVDNIENKITDPNECIVCHRILSCKSALQMHYRIHTGEKPFRCRICNRSFTTKGNLKTHMSVHRMKSPMNHLHQCPVCHKKFLTGSILQQHIRLHTGEPLDLTLEQIQAAEIRDYSPLSPNDQRNMSPFGQSGYGYNDRGTNESDSLNGENDDFLDEEDFEDEFDEDDETTSKEECERNRKLIEAHLKTEALRARCMEEREKMQREEHDHRQQNGKKSPPRMTAMEMERATSSPEPSESSQTALDLTPRSSSQASPLNMQGGPYMSLGIFPSYYGSANHLNSMTSSIMPATAFNPLGLPGSGPGRGGNTTCNICYKTLACHSALEIHYRSHTKERPFKCSICDRGFSTKSSGSGVQSERGCCTCNSVINNNSNNNLNKSNPITSAPYRTTTPATAPMTSSFLLHHQFSGNMKQHMMTHKLRDMPPQQLTGNSPSSSSSMDEQPPPSRTPANSTPSPKATRSSRGQVRVKLEKQQSPLVKEQVPNYEEDSLSRDDEPLSLLKSSASAKLDDSSPIMKLQEIKIEAGVKLLPDVEQPLLRNTEIKSSVTNNIIPISSEKSVVTNPSLQNHQLAELERMSPTGNHRLTDENFREQNKKYFNANLMEGRRPPPSSRTPPSSISLHSSAPVSPLSAVNTKHLCHVCRKNFSSSSAVQIHMRTHTGDKPFRCNVCQKAFTTKGNLKVHMGTHMWSNGASRRGRRMSLELPLNRPLPLSPQDSEYLQRRPDLFYHPYLASPFLNGMQQKLNDIGGLPPSLSSPSSHPSKYSGLMGFGNFITNSMSSSSMSHHSHSPSPSPVSEKSYPNHSPTAANHKHREFLDSPLPGVEVSRQSKLKESTVQSPKTSSERRLWDLHYERKLLANEGGAIMNGEESSSRSPIENRLPLITTRSQTRSEGLAA